MFPLVPALRSTHSAVGLPALFAGFFAVGSEEARLRAGLRPPPKLHVRFSRMQLSRRCSMLRGNRRYQSDKIHQPEIAI